LLIILFVFIALSRVFRRELPADLKL